MSWRGQHLQISKAEARRRLPPGACRDCVYYFAVHLRRLEDDPGGRPCTRCGAGWPDKAKLRFRFRPGDVVQPRDGSTGPRVVVWYMHPAAAGLLVVSRGEPTSHALTTCTPYTTASLAPAYGPIPRLDRYGRPQEIMHLEPHSRESLEWLRSLDDRSAHVHMGGRASEVRLF